MQMGEIFAVFRILNRIYVLLMDLVQVIDLQQQKLNSNLCMKILLSDKCVKVAEVSVNDMNNVSLMYAKKLSVWQVSQCKANEVISISISTQFPSK